jgi:hypothetical protein
MRGGNSVKPQTIGIVGAKPNDSSLVAHSRSAWAFVSLRTRGGMIDSIPNPSRYPFETVLDRAVLARGHTLETVRRLHHLRGR